MSPTSHDAVTVARRPTAAMLVALLVSALAALLPATAAEAAARSRSGAEARAETVSVALHNEARQHPDRFGYGSLPAAGEMQAWTDVRDVARSWSDKQAAVQTMSHNPLYSTQLCCWDRVAENVAYVTLRDLSDASVESASRRIFQSWMDSAGHRGNIMNAAYDQFGVGVSITPSSYGYTMYLTTNLRRVRGTPPGSAFAGPGVDAPASAPVAVRIPDPSTEVACGASTTVDAFVDLAASIHGGNVDCMIDWSVIARADGTSDGRFRVTDEADRAFIAAIIDRIATATGRRLPDATRDHFPDDDGHPYEAAINRVAEAGLAGGYGDGYYRPRNAVNRAQMATLLASTFRRFGYPTPSVTADAFGDDDGSVHEDNIDLVAELSIARGTSDTTFGPSQLVSRGQLTTFAARLVNIAAKHG